MWYLHLADHTWLVFTVQWTSFPSRPKPMFQSEAKCEAIHMTMVFNQERMSYVLSCFYSYTNKTHFHKEGSVVSLVTKVRVFVPVTRKWPIRHLYRSLNTPCLPPPHPPLPLFNSRPKRNWKQCLCKILAGKQGAFWEMCNWRNKLPFSFNIILTPLMFNEVDVKVIISLCCFV